MPLPRRTTVLLVAGVLAGSMVAGSVIPVEAATKPRRIVTGWMPYWAAADALQSMTDNSDLYTEVNGFWHSATGTATIADLAPDAQRSAAVTQAHAARLKVYGTVVDGTGTGSMASILRSPTRRLAHVRALVNLAIANHYDGIDLDYEGFAFHDKRATWDTTRPAWVTFVRQLGSALHKHGRKLAVSTPVIYDADRTDSSGYWVYDWHGIAPYVDRLRVMAYDFSVSRPGPIAPIAWVKSVVRFAVTQVPASRVQLGVPAYGRNWVITSRAGCPVDNMPDATAPTARQAEALATDNSATKYWDSTTQERWFTYRKTYSGHTASGNPASCRVTRKVIFDDAAAVLIRARLVSQYHLAGVALWALGYDGAGQFGKLRTYARSVAKRTPVISLYAGNTTYGQRITVSAKVTSLGGSPAKDLGWRLQFAPIGAGWKTIATGRTSSTGTMRFSRVPTSSGSYRLLVSGSWWYASGTSRPNASSVAFAVSAALSSTSVRHGHSVVLRGHADPRRDGLLVDRQVRQDGAWLTVASTHTSSTGGFSFRVTPPRAASYAYRVVVHSDGHRSTGYSTRLVLRAS